MEEEEEEEREEVLSKGEQMMTVSCHDGLACFLGSSAPSRLPCLSDTFKSREQLMDSRAREVSERKMIPLSPSPSSRCSWSLSGRVLPVTAHDRGRGMDKLT